MRHRTSIKILGLSLFTLVGVMAVSASTAQAGWLLLKNKTSVLLVDLDVHLDLSKLLVPELGVSLHCELGEGFRHVDLSSDHKILLILLVVLFTDCTDLNFGEVCTVRGVGDSAGSITVEGEGLGSMEGQKVIFGAESTAEAPFAEIVFEGEECPLVELDGRVFGSIEIEVLNPSSDTTSKATEVSDQNLSFGGQDAELHDSEEGAATGTTEEASGAPFAIHIVKL